MKQPENRFQPGPAYHPLVVVPAKVAPARPLISRREWPTLTVYANGTCRLNALATELLRTATAAALLPPPPRAPYYERHRGAKAWCLTAAPTTPSLAHPLRLNDGLLRFQALDAARRLLGGADAQPAVFALTPDPGHAARWRLLPLS